MNFCTSSASSSHLISRRINYKNIIWRSHIMFDARLQQYFHDPKSKCFLGAGHVRWMENKFNLWLALMRYQNASPESHPKKEIPRDRTVREATRMHYEMSWIRVPCAIRHHFFQFFSRRTQPPTKECASLLQKLKTHAENHNLLHPFFGRFGRVAFFCVCVFGEIWNYHLFRCRRHSNDKCLRYS